MELKLRYKGAEIFIPDNIPVDAGLKRTTHLGIGAHPDDLEILAYDGILKCFGNDKEWFFGIVVTDGAGSPRDGLYAQYSDEQMQKVRRVEQKKTAIVGEYGGIIFLNYPSAVVKDPKNPKPTEDVKDLILIAKPTVVYTHSLTDKHDTHVAVTLKTIEGLRELPGELKPSRVYGCEVWRDLDWMVDEDKVVFDVSGHENIATALVSIYDSQVGGGKRYDLATIGRRKANATYYATHGVDISTAMIYAMDLTPLIKDSKLDITEFVMSYINRFSNEVRARIKKLQASG